LIESQGADSNLILTPFSVQPATPTTPIVAEIKKVNESSASQGNMVTRSDLINKFVTGDNFDTVANVPQIAFTDPNHDFETYIGTTTKSGAFGDWGIRVNTGVQTTNYTRAQRQFIINGDGTGILRTSQGNYIRPSDENGIAVRNYVNGYDRVGTGGTGQGVSVTIPTDTKVVFEGVVRLAASQQPVIRLRQSNDAELTLANFTRVHGLEELYSGAAIVASQWTTALSVVSGTLVQRLASQGIGLQGSGTGANQRKQWFRLEIDQRGVDDYRYIKMSFMGLSGAGNELKTNSLYEFTVGGPSIGKVYFTNLNASNAYNTNGAIWRLYESGA